MFFGKRHLSVVLLLTAVGVPLASSACGSSDDPEAATPDSGTPPNPTSTTTATGTGTTPSPDGAPPAKPIPIKHVVVIVKENHTFDNYFGSFPGAEGATTCKKSDGSSIPCGRAPNFTSHDLSHAHSAGLIDYNNG